MPTRQAYGFYAIGGLSTGQVTIAGWAAGDTCLAQVIWYGTQTISSITMTGESNLTLLGSPQTGGPDNGRVQWAILDSVTGTGSKDIALTLSGAPTAFTLRVWRWSGAGSHGTPVGASGSGTTSSVSLTTTVANAAIVAGGTNVGGTIAAGTGYTLETTGADQYWYDGAEYDEDAGGAGSKTVDGTHASGAWCWSAIEIYAASSATVDQQSFRFGEDDGSESAHTWAAAQGTNITRALGSAFLLRTLLQATGDPASFAPVLRYQKNGAGGYAVVPVGPPASNIASVGTMGTGTSSTSSTSIVTTTATNALAAGETCLLVCVTDNTTTTDGNSNDHTACADSTAGAAGTWEKLYEYTNGEGAAAAGVTVSVWMLYATGALAIGSTVTVTLGTARVDKATSLWKFTSNTKLRLSTAATGNATDASNGFGSVSFSSLPSLQRLYFRGLGKEANSTTQITPSTSFTAITAQRSRNNAAAVLVRGEFRINTSTGETSGPTLAVSGDTAGVWLALEETPPDVFIAASANIAAGGEATTQRLTGGTGTFLTGRRWDDENGSDPIDLGTDHNSELEHSLNTQAPLANADYLDFLIYNGSTPLSGTPARLTIGTPATPSLPPVQSMFTRLPALRRF